MRKIFLYWQSPDINTIKKVTVNIYNAKLTLSQQSSITMGKIDKCDRSQLNSNSHHHCWTTKVTVSA
jgi:hypothetical protein